MDGEQFVEHRVTLRAAHRFKQGLPPGFTSKLLLVVFGNPWAGPTTVVERALHESTVVLVASPLHDRQALQAANPGWANQHELVHLLLVTGSIFDRNLRPQAARNEVIRRRMNEVVKVIGQAMGKKLDIDRLSFP